MQLGDVNPVDYEGGDVRMTETGPEIHWIVPPSDDDRWECEACDGSGTIEGDDADAWDAEATCVACRGTGENLALRWTLYRVRVEPLGTWVDWSVIATCCDGKVKDYKRAFKRDDVKAMAMAIWDVASYHGWHTLDGYPIELTRADVEKHFDIE